MTYSKEFLEETIKLWQPYLKEKLTLEDAREMTENAVAYIKLLIELDQKYGGQEKEQKKAIGHNSSTASDS